MNLRTRVRKQYDSAGIVTSEEYDFKGNLLRGTRQLAADYKDTPDWSGSVTLEEEVFTSSTTYDALNRPSSLISPDNSEIHPIYNEANLRERGEVRLRGAPAWTKVHEHNGARVEERLYMGDFELYRRGISPLRHDGVSRDRGQHRSQPQTISLHWEGKGMKRRGCITTGHGITHHGWGGGVVRIRWVSELV